MTGRALDPPRIIAAAIRVGPLTISVPPPGRHGDVMNPLYDLLGHFVADPDDQGFITSDGAFVDRKEGCRIAREAGQIVEHTGEPDVLYSEDMW